MKHNYPKARKPRNTEYSKTYKLLERYGEKKLYKLWRDLGGMYKTADYLTWDMEIWITPAIVRYLSHKFNWKRKISDISLPIVKSVLVTKNVPPSYFKHLIFVED